MRDDYTPAPTSKTSGDHAHAIVKAGLTAIPVVGGPASELFASLVTPPLERRRCVWMADVDERLTRLEAKGLDLTALSDNDDFIDIAMIASAAAVKTASEVKRAALRNAIINTASGQTPGESLAQVFISLIDSFTEWHLRILLLFQGPAEWSRSNGNDFGSLVASGLPDILEGAFPELEDQRPFYDQVWRDLYQAGLVDKRSFSSTTMSHSEAMLKRTSALGDSFLKFIEAD
jgi:hypothetical protein